MSESTTTASLRLQKAARAFLENLSRWFSMELSSVNEEVRTLDAMNHAAYVKYRDLAAFTQKLHSNLQLRTQEEELRPYIEMIDEIDRSAEELELTIRELDQYVKALESAGQAIVKTH